MKEQTNVLLEVKGLRVTTESRQREELCLVNDIDFAVKQGSVLGVVGESGSGKTMTCLSILQLLDRKTTKVEGSIRLRGRELNGLKEAELRCIRGKEIAYIMQNPMNAFSPVFTIGSQFADSICTHSPLSRKQAMELAAEALLDMNLPEPQLVLKRYPFELSGGMLQRAMIALAMCLKPALLLADEPTTALDTVNQLQVLRLLEKCRREHGTAIMLISHDLSVIAEMSDEVAVMQRGMLVERADVYELFRNPQQSYTKQLMDARPKVAYSEKTTELVTS
ncbi:ABC transporter ATP-binding protein [Paenibacillus sp. GD4]|uniref:ABC transporter ATP-binding protein n=1 Tax=Paenibacillus sp. GD4 TaxID=3068890 RepID=UPI0027967AEB|nr:ABC transporter ATP-binding protein [Paenibacillus sp. GD4]MDQ1913973.1 ABC transporter ATP-binding protein [Paenibacillus sp. GD4]